MNNITSYNQILESIKKVKDLKKGFVTNFFPEENRLNLWIGKKIFFEEHFSNSVMFFRKNETFYNLYFVTTDTISLSNLLLHLKSVNYDKLFVTDIIGRESGLNNILSIFENNDYFQYTSLQRMISSSHFESQDGIIKNVKSARTGQAPEILHLLYHYFDPFAEQLPYIEEINHWIESQTLKVIEENNKIIGFVIYDLIGLTSNLRYWFVHPDHRNKNIGSALLRTYFQHSINANRLLFWVIKSNQNAIKRYLHYGYRQENLNDYVMINKKIKYERPDS